MTGKIILNTSDEAAKRVTITGWVSRTGQFFGDDERSARWSGATHITCECGQVTPKGYTKCEACRKKASDARYAALPKAPWDGKTMLSMFDDDRYFADIEEAEEYAFEIESTLADLQLVLCAPVYAQQIDPNEHYCDDLAEDSEVPAEIEEAFRVLNEAIKNCREPLCFRPSKTALQLEKP